MSCKVVTFIDGKQKTIPEKMNIVFADDGGKKHHFRIPVAENTSALLK